MGCAIHRACNVLASDPAAFATFNELLASVRMRAPRLFEAPIEEGRHLGVDVLLHLARFRKMHIRSLRDWDGTRGSWRVAVASLARHLTCRYTIPPFMTSVWHAADNHGDTKRGWVIAHAGGASFRSLSLPMKMTRTMERIFLASADHLTMEWALRRAELLALGMPKSFIDVVLATRLSGDLSNSDFWRTVWMFLRANAEDMCADEIGPMIDYLQFVRHDRIHMDTGHGAIDIAPPQPNFSMKGRTVQSMLRLMKGWHRDLAYSRETASLTWARSGFSPWAMEEPRRSEDDVPRVWELKELTDSEQLLDEGRSLHHCVGSYAYLCYRGSASIWSLRMWRGAKKRSVLTIEVDPKRRVVIQARGRANLPAAGKVRALVNQWAQREGLATVI